MKRWWIIAFCTLALACGDDDGMSLAGDGDGDGMAGDGDGMAGDGDGMAGDGDGMAGDGDGDADPAYTRIAGGTFGPLEGYDSSTASGAALIAVHATDGTEVSLQVNGLTADTDYPAHVHALPCDMSGGGHYKVDPSVEDTAEDNELWSVFTTDADGNATAALEDAHVARGDAMSIVIHDPEADNAKMLCADLVTTNHEAELTGMFAPFADAEDGDQTIAGTASLTRTSTSTTVAVEVEGLASDAEYAVHVHALPCGEGDAGGHYKLDPAIEDTQEDNELWPTVTAGDDGTASDSFKSDHVARGDAQSIVIHRKTEDMAPKVACADLVAEPYAFVVTGDAVAFDLAGERDLDSLEGEAEIKRRPDGTSAVEVEVSGLTPETEYPTHVHDQPCDVASGGGHYKTDTSETETVEANEVWVTLTTDAQGADNREVEADHALRAEAQAIVIHDTDGERLACIPLD